MFGDGIAAPGELLQVPQESLEDDVALTGLGPERHEGTQRGHPNAARGHTHTRDEAHEGRDVRLVRLALKSLTIDGAVCLGAKK